MAVAMVADLGGWFEVTSWSPDGRLLAGNLQRADASSAGPLVYSLESRQFKQPVQFGAWPHWLSDSRRFLFSHEGKLFLADSPSGTTHVVLSLEGQQVDEWFDLSRDDRFIYFSMPADESDVWLMEFKRE